MFGASELGIVCEAAWGCGIDGGDEAFGYGDGVAGVVWVRGGVVAERGEGGAGEKMGVAIVKRLQFLIPNRGA